MTDSWGNSPPPPPPAAGGPKPSPRGPGGSAHSSSGVTRRSSGAFRDTLIVAGLAVVGVGGMVVWSGGDVPSGAPTPNSPDLTLPPALTLPDDGFASPAPATANVGPTPAGSAEAFIATFPVPAGGVEQPAADGRTRSWFIAGKNWQAARDGYLGALAAQGITAQYELSIDQDGMTGETYVLTDPATSLTVRLEVVDLSGQIVVEVSA